MKRNGFEHDCGDPDCPYCRGRIDFAGVIEQRRRSFWRELLWATVPGGLFLFALWYWTEVMR